MTGLLVARTMSSLPRRRPRRSPARDDSNTENTGSEKSPAGADRIARRSAPLAAPGAAQLHVGAEAGHRGGAGDGRAVFERLPRALQPDQAEVVQRRDA